MQRKNSDYHFSTTKRDFIRGVVPLHKFHGVRLTHAVQLITDHLSKKVSYFPFADQNDFQFGVDGLSKLLEVLPSTITSISFNVRYVLKMQEEDWIKLTKSIPAHVTWVKLNYIDEYDEYPALDFCDQQALNPDPGPNSQQLKMLIESIRQYLSEKTELAYDFGKYGIVHHANGMVRKSSSHTFFGDEGVKEVGGVEKKLESKLSS